MTKSSFLTFLKLFCLQLGAQGALMYQGADMAEASVAVGAVMALMAMFRDVRVLYRRAFSPIPQLMGC